MAATTLPDIEPHQSSPGRNVEFSLNEVQFGDGYEQVSQKGINHIREAWDLQWLLEQKTDVDILVAFFEGLGGFLPFFWQAPGDVAPKLWRVRAFRVQPTSGQASTLDASFKLWVGEEPA